MYGIEWMRLLATREANVFELRSHKFKESGSVIAIFEEREGRWSVAEYDKNDIELWEMAFDNEEDAWSEYHKRVAEGPVDKRTGAKR